MKLRLSTVEACGRRDVLKFATWAPFLLRGLDQPLHGKEIGADCAHVLLSQVEISLAENRAFVTSQKWSFETGFFGFSLGHSHENQLLLSRQLGQAAKSDQLTLVRPQFKELVGLFEADQVALVPEPNRIPVPLFLLSNEPVEWAAGKGRHAPLMNVDIRVTGDECIDLILELLLESVGLKELAVPIGKVILKSVDGKILKVIEKVVRARDWSGLAEVASTLLEKLASRDAIVLLGEVGGAVARKKFLLALASRFVPFVGTAIIVVTLVGLVRKNWDSVRTKCGPAVTT